MAQKDDGGPAFPMQASKAPSSCYPNPGMSLRDWFAGQFAAGMVANCTGRIGEDFSAYAKGPHNGAIVNRAYVLADAMLRERSKEGA